MKFDNLKEAIQFRINESEDEYWIEDYWKAEIEIFTENISETIDFILNSCSDEELFWISEVFEDIAEQTQSKEFIKTLRTRLEKVTRENYRQENFKSKLMRNDIDFDEFQRSVGEEIENAKARIN